jgi:hypothetical protein
MTICILFFTGVEILYIQGTNFDQKKKDALKAAWKRNLSSQRTEFFDQTFIRVYIDPNAPPAPEEE